MSSNLILQIKFIVTLLPLRDNVQKKNDHKPHGIPLRLEREIIITSR